MFVLTNELGVIVDISPTLEILESGNYCIYDGKCVVDKSLVSYVYENVTDIPAQVKPSRWMYDGNSFSKNPAIDKTELTPQEVDEYINTLRSENTLLKEQVSALSNQNDFQEELIVELANIVYA